MQYYILYYYINIILCLNIKNVANSHRRKYHIWFYINAYHHIGMEEMLKNAEHVLVSPTPTVALKCRMWVWLSSWLGVLYLWIPGSLAYLVLAYGRQFWCPLVFWLWTNEEYGYQRKKKYRVIASNAEFTKNDLTLSPF